ncbi:MAG TPA: IS982 family transposase [Solirubrobacterales bacterium]
MLKSTVDPKGATMLADLDLLLTAVFCTADDLLPEGKKNARRRLTHAEVLTLCVAQSIMGISSDERFAKIARKRLRHLFPGLTRRSGLHKRRERLTETIEAMIATFSSRCPGYHDDLLLADSTPVECARSRETVKRGGSSRLGDAIADTADYGYCASHSRWFWGFRLHTLMAPDGTPRAMALTSPKEGEREVCLRLLERARRSGPVTVLGDKGYAGSEFEADAAELGATVLRPRRKDEPGAGPHLAPLRQRIESIYWSAKDILALERHGARTLRGLRVRIAARFLALAAAISLNYDLGRNSRALVDYVA